MTTTVWGVQTVVTEQHMKLPWSGSPKNFRCYLCGHRFQLGERFRMVFVERGPSNVLACADCDGPDAEVQERWEALARRWEERRGIFWWFIKQERIRGEQDYANEQGRREWEDEA